ncbi:hypothetical protein DMUE_2413 [Dictyocoela muelleri]|nr:hypothetical protein DMUE_2413 [Dictyocoela muelleri]
MFNFKCKSHRGKSPSNRTDALCIIELENRSISMVYATTILIKEKTTLVPIIVYQVSPMSIILTDEHRSYACLHQFNYTHNTVCHKYEYVNSHNAVNTQPVESFHNELKLEIKRCKKNFNTKSRQIFISFLCLL